MDIHICKTQTFFSLFIYSFFDISAHPQLCDHINLEWNDINLNDVNFIWDNILYHYMRQH